MNFWRWLAAIGYPVLIILSLWLQQPRLRSLGLPLLAIAVVGPLPRSRRGIAILLITGMLALLVLWKPVLALWPPSLLCLSAATWFGLSLRAGKTPLIERFAIIVLRSHGHSLPHDSERWMRCWTGLWAALMALLGIVGLALAASGMISVWSIWMMVVTPSSMLVLLLLEFYLRRYRFPEQPRWSPFYFLQTVVRIPPHKVTEPALFTTRSTATPPGPASAAFRSVTDPHPAVMYSRAKYARGPFGREKPHLRDLAAPRDERVVNKAGCMKSLPLTYRAKDDIILMHAGAAVTRSHFVGLCEKLARQLPEQPSVINLCEDRLAFSVTFCATLLAGGTNLLPANRAPATIDQLLSRQPRAIIISDRDNRGMYVSAVEIGTVLGQAAESPDLPCIPADQLAAVVYTSGSTGPSSKIRKTWRTLHDSSRINMAEYGPDGLTHCLATVPSQHMWGLETTVLAPLFAPLVLASDHPLLVADIIAGLQRLPSPAALITTPVHLRALVEAGIPLPRLDRIYSATAPLTTAMAQRLEQLTGAVVIDVYGCSEAGCLATRATAHEDHWRLFKAFKLERVGNAYLVSAPHLPAPVALMDLLKTTDSRRFKLVGRQDDLINIAGKRASMADLTRILLDTPGVIDGVIFQPPANNTGKTTRLAALVVAPGLTASELRKRLGDRIDPAFMPRPLRLVESLPRSRAGKLPQQDLLHVYNQVCEGV